MEIAEQLNEIKKILLEAAEQNEADAQLDDKEFAERWYNHGRKAADPGAAVDFDMLWRTEGE